MHVQYDTCRKEGKTLEVESDSLETVDIVVGKTEDLEETKTLTDAIRFV